MARSIANVVTATDTFASWIARTNQLADAMTVYAVTVESNSTGATVTGNGSVNGFFSANTLIARDALRGGTVAASGNLNITSNGNFFGAVLYSSANLVIEVANAHVNATILYLNGGLANVTSNVSVVTSNVSVNAANVSIKGGNTHVSSNTIINAANIVVNSTNTVLSGTTLNITSNVDIVATTLNANAVITVNGNTTVTANDINLRANSTVGFIRSQSNGTTTNTTISGNLVSINANVEIANTLTVTNSAIFSNSLSVSGNAVFSTTANVAGAVRAGNTTVNGNLTVNTFLVVGTVTNTANLNVTTSANVANLTVTGFANLQSSVEVQNNYVIIVTSNTNVGANTTGAQTVFSFPKTTYSTAKLTAQVKTASDANTQINEIVIAHDGTTSYLTVYGTVSSPLSSNLGVFTTSINNANVELFLRQNTANSKVKIVAHLIK